MTKKWEIEMVQKYKKDFINQKISQKLLKVLE